MHSLSCKSCKATILTGVSGSNSGWMVLGYTCSCWKVACLSEAVAALCQPTHGNGLVCLDTVLCAYITVGSRVVVLSVLMPWLMYNCVSLAVLLTK